MVGFEFFKSRSGSNSIRVLFPLNPSFKDRMQGELMVFPHLYWAVKNQTQTKHQKSFSLTDCMFQNPWPCLNWFSWFFNAAYSKEKEEYKSPCLGRNRKSQSQRPLLSLQPTELCLIRFKFIFLNLSTSASQANLFFYSKGGIREKHRRGKEKKNKKIKEES